MSLKTRLPRVLVVPALLSMLIAAWAGLLRLGWSLPPFQAAEHGPLMISGFLGTLIALERAVALSASFKYGSWAYAAPIFSALGSLALVLGAPHVISIGFITLGSVGLFTIFLVIVRRQPALFSMIMLLGALCWLIGNIFWLTGQPIYRVVEWWIAFLVLTIAGERLELTRILRHTAAVQKIFMGIVCAYLLGLILITLQIDAGTPLIGVSLFVLGIWLFRYDIARRTVKQSGLTRYIAVCLLLGYGWLLVGGILRIVLSTQIAGAYYDAELHSILLGFVFSMIFGHAPIILPAVLKVSMPFRRGFYIPLLLLHAALVLRISADLTSLFVLRQWGGMFNVIAILVFLVVTISVLYQANRAKRGDHRQQVSV